MERAQTRLRHIQAAIADIRMLLDGKTVHDLTNDRIVQAALERFLEIISEASRHVPQEMKDRRPQLPWRRIADIGNTLRHAYHRVDPAILWSIYENDLASLETVVAEMMAEAENSIPGKSEPPVK